MLNKEFRKLLNKKTILLAGGTGYIGSAVANQLSRAGYRIISLVRRKTAMANKNTIVIEIDITNADLMKKFSMSCPSIDIIISCIGSKTGGIKDSWRVEYDSNKNLMNLGASQSVEQFILLSAICVQRPKLEFQYAKLAFENALIQSELPYTIVRPTAFFKSLSGQIKNLKLGKKFIYFDGGETTSCKPISQSDLANYISQSIGVKKFKNKILPIGGPGPAITPLQMGSLLFELMNKKPKFKSIPSTFLSITDKLLAPMGYCSQRIRDIQEFTRIAKYYATESMLLYNLKTNCYDDNLTPTYGDDTLEQHYRTVIESNSHSNELGAHKLF